MFGKWIGRNEKARREFNERVDILKASRSARESTQMLLMSVMAICISAAQRNKPQTPPSG
ncbi:hypothetical protein PT2222_250181 [Paraburkholderia tropica]